MWWMLASATLVVQAATPSAAQIEQFKRMSPQQKAALAKQFGIELPSLSGNRTENATVQRDSAVDDRVENLNLEPVFSSAGRKADELEPFGYRLFAQGADRFDASLSGAVPAGYVLGPGDEIQIRLYGKETQDYLLPVSRDGQILFPELGPIAVAGLRAQDAFQLVKQRVESEIIGAKVLVSLGQLRSISVLALGEVKSPGTHVVSGLATMTHVLSAVGGISEVGSLREVQLKRRGRVVARLDLYDLLLKGDTSRDARVQEGDVVFIPPVGTQVSVKGDVRRPAIYELKEGETLTDLIAFAGGFSTRANQRNVLVTRQTPEGVGEAKVFDFSDPGSRKKAERFSLKAGDVVQVGKVNGYVSSAVHLIGAVTHAGDYGWRPGLHLRDVLRDLDADLLPEADRRFILILRQNGPKRDWVPMQADLESGDNPQLNKHDRIYVFAATDEQLTSWKERLVARLLLDDSLEARTLLMDWLVGDPQLPEAIQKIAGWTGLSDQTNGQHVAPTSGQGADAKPGTQESEKYAALRLAATDADDKNEESGQDGTQFGWPQLDRQAILNAARWAGFDDAAAILSSRAVLMPEILNELQGHARLDNPLPVYEVRGAVHYPGVYPIPVQLTAKTIVDAAGGLTDSAYSSVAEITHRLISKAGLTIQHESIQLADALREQKVIRLGSRDSVHIRNVPEWSEQGTVSLQGEVKFPGVYAIRKGETLRELIQRAGGLTDDADPRATIFTRERLRKLEEEQLAKVSQQLRSQLAAQVIGARSANQSSGDVNEVSRLVDVLESAKPVGRLVIDLPRMLAGSLPDLPLENGDTLILPPRSHTVTVLGEVNHPTSHLLDPRLGVDEYIARSGGMTAQADDDRIFVIRADGSVRIPERSKWFSRDEGALQPGDTIVVPLDTEYMGSLAQWTSITQIIYQSAIAVAAVSRIN
jgi:protein involved in polysaccharide export with SLBB domain